VARRAIKKHWHQLLGILAEIWVIRNPQQLAELAAQRKPQMMLLPYGIPLAIGTITYFVWMGMLI
jgi:prepilin peptidase CpaA